MNLALLFIIVLVALFLDFKTALVVAAIALVFLLVTGRR